MMLCSSRYSLNMIVPFTTAKSPAAEAYGTAPNLANSKASVNALEYTIAASEARAGTSPPPRSPLPARDPQPAPDDEALAIGRALERRRRGRSARATEVAAADGARGKDGAKRRECPVQRRAPSQDVSNAVVRPAGRLLT